ncbi:MAG: heme lyase CcmF/NrfE family subunit, partial [Marinicaulis sp.]|nr:heme lyase CcmF/NrfE family subunit [Marinicaulis sp.]
SAAPFAGLRESNAALYGVARKSALTQGALILLAFLALTYAHATSDFSVVNVVENSHSAKPAIYKFTGVWGNHEGSMLLWVLILAGFGAVLATSRDQARTELNALALGAQGMVAAAFLAFILFTSNPFARILPAPADGMDLNPLLQDPGLAIHPPFLYLGYVGLSITFAFAVAGLLQGKIDEDWARAVRPWTLAAWVFLTIGIALGSWWAYYELGWGGFWAWDPVENASFMPWLAATAFIHSVRVVEKRGALKVWTVLLAILGFSLSLVGTFLVRSGLLTSVHAFAVDPTRGVFILAILAAAIGGSLFLFAVRAPLLKDSAAFDPVSRESAILLNNVFLATACATVFIGTFYPLFIDVLSGERLSVGAPFFNATFLPLMALMLLMIAPGAAMAWKKGDLKKTLQGLWPVALASIVVVVVAASLAWPKTIAAAFGAGLAAWAMGGAAMDFAKRTKLFSKSERDSWSRFKSLPRPYLGMTIAHIGLGVLIVGVMGAGVWRTEVVKLMQPADVISVGGYDATLREVVRDEGPNFLAERAVFDVARNGKPLRSLSTERRFYPVRQMQTTEAGIWTTLKGDLYLTLGERPAGGGWAVRAYFNPFAVWLWIGSGLIALGGAVAAMKKRIATATLTDEENLVETPAGAAQVL